MRFRSQRIAKQAVKCHNCYHRTEIGLEPVCVPPAPFGRVRESPSLALPRSALPGWVKMKLHDLPSRKGGVCDRAFNALTILVNNAIISVNVFIRTH